MRTWAAIAAAVLACSCHAQLLTDAGAAITITAGTQLTVKGDVLAGPGSGIANGGTIDLSGDLTNDSGGALFAPVAGSVILNGASQSIGGADATAFDALDLQCIALSLQQDAIVGGTYASPAGALQLRDALLHLNAHRLTVTNAAATAITRVNGQVISETDPLMGYGTVEWWIGGGTGTYVVPFGDGVSYLPVTLNIGVSGSGAGSVVLATYPTDPSATPNNRPLPTGLPVLTDLAGLENAPNVLDRFWIVEPSGYSTAPTAALTFTYRDSEWNSGTNTISEALLQAQRSTGSNWSQPPNGTVNTVQNTVTTTPTNGFATIWALVQSSTPLPVELLEFTAMADGSAVRCAWVTASELGNDHFTVERSADGVSFHDIGAVQGAGTTQEMQQYALLDHAPMPGLAYYRLRQTDLDGREDWSPMVPVIMPTAHDAATLVLWPNPATDAIRVAGTRPDEHLVILDASGRVVIDAGVTSDAPTSVDLKGLSAGPYLVRVSSRTQQRSARFIRNVH